jgi:predicted GNAT family acetyltransferase
LEDPNRRLFIHPGTAHQHMMPGLFLVDSRMQYTEYKDPEKFLEVCRHVFEQNEALYGLMLGITLRLIKNPLHYGSQALLATIDIDSKLSLTALMTPPYKLQIVVLDSDPLEEIEFLCSKLIENGWKVPGVMGEEKAVRAFETCWKKLTSTESNDGMMERLYVLHSVNPIHYPPGSFRKATMDDFELALGWGHAFYHECFGDVESPMDLNQITRTMLEEGSLYLWLDPNPVSMAATTRPTLHGISISYVYTPPEHRRKGYGSAIVASLTQLMLDKGRKFCTLYTDLSNPTSNSIYQRIGYKPVADIVEVNFEKS